MKHLNWRFFLGLSLVAASTFLYLIHFTIFSDAHHIFIYLLGDLAFVPLEVFLVTLILHRLLEEREKSIKIGKLNMVIGSFFSEVGTGLLGRLSEFDYSPAKATLLTDFNDLEMIKSCVYIKNGTYAIDSRKGDLEGLRIYLIEKREFMVVLLQNPNLLEHESFTDLLRKVFHLAEELEYRPDVKSLPGADYQHLSDDMARAYSSLFSQWLLYVKYLRDNYPYLFSLALRINPLNPCASVPLEDKKL